MSGGDALRRFLRSLEARDASPHTLRSYEATLRGYLAWLEARDTDWRSPGRTVLRAYLAELGAGHARSSVAQHLAAIRTFHRYAARTGLAPGDPWGAIATPRLHPSNQRPDDAGSSNTGRAGLASRAPR